MRSLLSLLLCAGAAAAPFASNKFITVRLDDRNASLSVTDQRTKRTWLQQPAGAGITVTSTRAERQGIRAMLHDAANNLDLTALIVVAKDKPEIEISITANGP